MIRAYIVDDEKLAVQRLSRMLKDSGRVDIAGTTTDPVNAVAFLNGHDVDVLFLDIQMPELSGFQLLEQLDRPPHVIFTTAFDQYALNAFEVSSIDYLLKPIDSERLDRALDKAERFVGGTRPDARALARELASQLAPGRRLERIASKVGERTTLLDVARVTHFSARDKLTYASINGREHIVDLTLVQLEERLDPRRFVRIHRATIVNTTYIHELYPDVDGGVLVRLKDDARTELGVARDRVRDLKQHLGI